MYVQVRNAETIGMKARVVNREARTRRGFSLLELLICVALIGILAGVVIARTQMTAHEAKATSCAANEVIINKTVERWYAEHGAWPASDLSDIGSDVDYFPGGIPECPFNRAYGLDPLTRRVVRHED